MPLASSQGNQPALARLPERLPTTQAEWTHLIQALQSWQRALQTVTWQTPTLQNGWVAYGSPWAPPGYTMDAAGRVHLRGLVKSGTIGQAICTLPAGYVPPYDATFSVISADAFGEVRVYPSGEVFAAEGSNAWVSLDGVSFSIN